jgi:hypothetical protein
MCKCVKAVLWIQIESSFNVVPGFRSAKITHKNIACSFNVIKGGLEISELHYWSKKREKNFSCIFFQFLVISTLDPDQNPELDPDQDP